MYETFLEDVNNILTSGEVPNLFPKVSRATQACLDLPLSIHAHTLALTSNNHRRHTPPQPAVPPHLPQPTPRHQADAHHHSRFPLTAHARTHARTHVQDELGSVLDELRPAAKAAGAGETADALYGFLLERVRTNLHVVLCLSPVGEAFRERCRMFPGLVNCTTIDWWVSLLFRHRFRAWHPPPLVQFTPARVPAAPPLRYRAPPYPPTHDPPFAPPPGPHLCRCRRLYRFTEWPADALFEVAQKQLMDVDLGSTEVKTAVCKVGPEARALSCLGCSRHV